MRLRVTARSLHDLEAVFLDDGVCEHFFRNVLELFLRFVTAPAIEIQNEEFSLADVTHCGIAEPGQGVLNCLSLGIEYRTFWHDPDVCFHGVSITLPWSASCSVGFAAWRKGVFETHVDNSGQLVFLQAHARGVCILFLQRGVKHCRVIGGEHDGYAVAQKFWERMIFDSYVLSAELPSECGGLHIAPRAYLKGDFSLRKEIH